MTAPTHIEVCLTDMIAAHADDVVTAAALVRHSIDMIRFFEGPDIDCKRLEYALDALVVMVANRVGTRDEANDAIEDRFMELARDHTTRRLS